MNTFRVYKHPVRGFQAVKAGWSWPALCFGILWMLLWMLLKRLWGKAIIWFAAGNVIHVIFHLPSSEDYVFETIYLFSTLTATCVLWIAPASLGDEGQMKKLSKQGYELTREVQSETFEAAIRQYKTS